MASCPVSVGAAHSFPGSPKPSGRAALWPGALLLALVPPRPRRCGGVRVPSWPLKSGHSLVPNTHVWAPPPATGRRARVSLVFMLVWGPHPGVLRAVLRVSGAEPGLAALRRAPSLPYCHSGSHEGPPHMPTPHVTTHVTTPHVTVSTHMPTPTDDTHLGSARGSSPGLVGRKDCLIGLLEGSAEALDVSGTHTWLKAG